MLEQNIGAFKLFHFKVVDYAGLFPPASLSLDEAIQNFSKYRMNSDKWMLSRFIIPGSRLKELHQYIDLFSKNPPFLFSVLGKQCNSMEEFENHFDSLLQEITNFQQKQGEIVKVDALELKSPITTESNSYKEFLDILNSKLLKFTLPFPVEIFLELNSKILVDNDLEIFLGEIRKFNENNKNKNIGALSFKLRTGGVKSSDFPSIEQVSKVIKLCAEYKVSWKATAGLHHPIRHFNSEVNTKMHGFINVIGATVLNDHNELKIDEIEEILADEDPSNFKFTEHTFSWKKIETHQENIYKSRFKSFLSFGSCSFDEPREDLRKLKLL